MPEVSQGIFQEDPVVAVVLLVLLLLLPSCLMSMALVVVVVVVGWLPSRIISVVKEDAVVDSMGVRFFCSVPSGLGKGDVDIATRRGELVVVL